MSSSTVLSPTSIWPFITAWMKFVKVIERKCFRCTDSLPTSRSCIQTLSSSNRSGIQRKISESLCWKWISIEVLEIFFTVRFSVWQWEEARSLCWGGHSRARMGCFLIGPLLRRWSTQTERTTGDYCNAVFSLPATSAIKTFFTKLISLSARWFVWLKNMMVSLDEPRWLREVSYSR